MSGYYPPNPHLPPGYYSIDPNAVPNVNMAGVPQMISPDGSMPHGMPYLQQYPEPPLHPGYLDQYEDVPGVLGTAPGGNARMRRRSQPGEHVKHRRTRSGCFTCRNRRVKCDENRPICERCRKGNRECVYPEPQTSSKSGRSGTKGGQKSSPQESGSSPEDNAGDSKEPLAAIPDDEEDEGEYESFDTAVPDSRREVSDTPSLTHDRSPSPSTESSATVTTGAPRPPLLRTSSGQTSKQASTGMKSFADLPQDIKFYLNYHKTQMTPHHYSLKYHSMTFFKTGFLEMALKYEPLLYAAVGFAAYYHTLTKPTGRMSNFLQYYNKSVSLLRQSLSRSKKHSLATLATILQLASIEELLGDWVNLMNHQRAAYEVLTQLYTPETIMKTETQRKVLAWYIRFDLYVSLQSGGEALLEREWYVAMRDCYEGLLQQNPDDLHLKYEMRFCISRLIASDSSAVFARKARGSLSDEEFMAQVTDIGQRLSTLEKNIDPALVDPSQYITDFTGAPPRDPDDIVDPYAPNTIWKEPLWTSNYMYFDMWGIEFMYQVQMSLSMRRPFDPAMTEKAYRVAQMFEAIISWPQAPAGAIVEAHSALAIATLFLPKDHKTIQWCRRIFAKVEAAGYIYSTVMRNKMLEGWGLEPSDWWLPNDEGCPPIIRSIKNFINDRNSQPRDQASDDLREIRGIFSNLTLSDTPSPDRPGEMTPGGSQTRTMSNIDETLVYAGGSPEFGWNYDQDKFSGMDQYGQGQYPGQ